MSINSFHVVLVKSNIPSVILTKDSDKYIDVEGMNYIGVLNDSCTEPKEAECLVLKAAIGQMLSALNKTYYGIKWDNKKNILDKLIISFDEENTHE